MPPEAIFSPASGTAANADDADRNGKRGEVGHVVTVGLGTDPQDDSGGPSCQSQRRGPGRGVVGPDNRCSRQTGTRHVDFGQHSMLRFGIIVTNGVVGFRGQTLSRNQALPSRSASCPADDEIMNPTSAPQHHRSSRGRWFGLVLAVAVLSLGGCSRLRLPAIDPTGSCLFAPLPTTTTLALPGSSGEGCFGRLREHNCLGKAKDLLHHDGGFLGGKCNGLGCFGKDGFTPPVPAFPEPAAPPPCQTPGSVAGGCNEPTVPGPGCGGSCKHGPPAVLLGSECCVKDYSRLPKHGKRGCILLSPLKVVAPVGGEVVLMSGICGTDGYLQMNEPLEWMLTPDSVGTFIQVGDDDPGLLHRLVGSKKRPEKHDPSYAHGITSTKRALITRGNTDPRDDVQLEKGQTWITISSPSEGTSRVTVLAPESDCWDQRKATATIYWVDARWQFPSPQIVPAGQPVELTTRVTRSEEAFPARGWKVRYEILQPELATFGGTAGASVVEANVDDSGNATVGLVPNPGTSGTAEIRMQVIRPGGDSDNLPTLTLGSGSTFVTWSSPQLTLRAGAPSVATFDTPFQVVANLANPGDQAATNVRVDVPVPPGARVVGADSFARVLPNSVTWEIGTVPPQQQLDLFLDIAAQSPVELNFQARGDGLVAEDTVRVDVFRPSLAIRAEPVEDRVESGQPVRFNIDVTNTGNRPLQNVTLTANGGESMLREDGAMSAIRQKEDGLLQPGETWGSQVTFIPNRAGQRCVNFIASGDGGQRADQQACVTVINPIPRTPNLEAELRTSRSAMVTGQQLIVQNRIVNTGQGPARNVEVTMVYDPQLQLVEATLGADPERVGQNIVTWSIPEIQPGQEVKLEGIFTAIGTSPRTRVAWTASSLEGSQVNRDVFVEIRDGATAPAEPPPSPVLPPTQPTPEVPGGPAPLQGPPPGADATPTAPAGPVRSERLQTQLQLNDNPARVGEPIRYRLIIVNDASVPDGQVSVQFGLPDGVTLDRVVPITNPELGERRIDAGVVSLAYIPLMNPGERIEYAIVLRCNQPKDFDLNVQVRSQRMPDGVVESVTTTVIP